MLFAFCIGLIWMALVQCLPRQMAIAALLFGSLTLLACGIILFIDNPPGWQGF